MFNSIVSTVTIYCSGLVFSILSNTICIQMTKSVFRTRWLFLWSSSLYLQLSENSIARIYGTCFQSIVWIQLNGVFTSYQVKKQKKQSRV